MVEEIVLQPDKEVRYTKQEKSNYRQFIFNLVMFIINILSLIAYVHKQRYLVVGLGVVVLTVILMHMFYIGHSLGWEHKRISIEEQLDNSKGLNTDLDDKDL